MEREENGERRKEKRWRKGVVKNEKRGRYKWKEKRIEEG